MRALMENLASCLDERLSRRLSVSMFFFLEGKGTFSLIQVTDCPD